MERSIILVYEASQIATASISNITVVGGSVAPLLNPAITRILTKQFSSSNHRYSM